MTTSIKDFNWGGYLQVGGTSVTLTVGSDGLTLGVGGQLSVGYTVSGTTNINYSLSGGWAIQPSVMQGLGTPTGMPGVSVSVMRGVDAPTTQLQVGAGWNDLLEVGLTGSITTNSTAGFNYSNEGRNYQTTTSSVGNNYRGAGFTDSRILDNPGSYRVQNTYSDAYASKAAEDAAFEWDNAQGYRTSVDASGNTVYVFESGTTLYYRNMAPGVGGADMAALSTVAATGERPKSRMNSGVNLDLIAPHAVFMRAVGRFKSRIGCAANAAKWRMSA